MNNMNPRNFAALLSMALFMGLSACSTTGGAEADETDEQAQTQHQNGDNEGHAPEDEQQMMAQMCPMQVEGTTREMVRLDDAVAMDLTTTGDVEELRQRVNRMVQMHGGDGQMQHGHGHGHGGDGQRQQGQMSEEQRQMHREMMEMMADVTVESEEIDEGVRVIFTPEDSEQVDQLHGMMQQHTAMMEEQGQCPMMQMTGGDSNEGNDE